MNIESIINYSPEEKRQLFLMLIQDQAVQPLLIECVNDMVEALLPDITKRLDRIDAEIEKRKNEAI